MPNPLHDKGYAHFVGQLRICRERVGITQAQLATLLNVPQSYVSKCEAGTRRLDIIELREWLNALQLPFVDFVVSLDSLLGHEAEVAKRLRMGANHPK
jgi:transcriptional regulator with XRE-family HTH domain